VNASPAVTSCDNCGWEPTPPRRAIDYIDADLIELGKPIVQPSDAERKIFYAELRGYQETARKKDGSPYHPKWAACQFKDKHKTWPPRSWDDHPPAPPSDVTRRWIKSRQIAWAKRNSPMRRCGMKKKIKQSKQQIRSCEVMPS
jgi:hypothetical protein